VNNSSLKYLDLTQNRLNTRCSKALAMSLRTNSSLIRLEMGKNTNTNNYDNMREIK
jgi:hypothetical protein